MEIKKTRITINNHLDKLQEDLMKQINELEEEGTSKICQLLSSLEKKEKEIEECQNSILNIKKHTTDLQMFLSIKQIEEDVYSKEFCKLQWTFHNESVLKTPYGIDVDNDGNVFVVGHRSNNVVVISSDGKRHREILTVSDGLDNPMSLHYSGTTNQLLVANYFNSKLFC
ncbi:unnamed protein product [Mytilus edulis]|uniref:Uncharacterized protein n=1 Tax=Mytilus edulis TaxID=6550 RepID=A0A8S3TIW4_MYTED|nr:unnamed protein product [Mytilus edulis]